MRSLKPEMSIRAKAWPVGAWAFAHFPSNPALAAFRLRSRQVKVTLTPVERNRRHKAGQFLRGRAAIQFHAGTTNFPFEQEKPLFAITAANVAHYANNLRSAKELFRYHDYRMDIYPTHRSAALPSSVYENTFQNATPRYAPADWLWR